ncbi:MAG: tetratricopeptide repeat protein [Gemmatimonadales bacterium]
MAYSSEIERLERRHAENPQGRTFAPLAEAYRKAGDLPRALELLSYGLELHPDYLSASVVLGRCHMDLGDLPQAETAFRRVLDLDRENVIAIKALAEISERTTRLDEAEHWLTYLLTIDAGNAEAREQLARVSELQRSGPAAPVAPAAGEAPEPESAESGETAPAAEMPSPEPAQPSASEAETQEVVPVAPLPAEAPELPPVEAPAPAWGWEPTAYRGAEPEPDAPSLLNAGPEDVEEEPLAAAGDVDEPFVEREEDDILGTPGGDLGVMVDKQEEIVLRPSSSSEFQTPSDADTLIGGQRRSGDYYPGVTDSGSAGTDDEPAAAGVEEEPVSFADAGDRAPESEAPMPEAEPESWSPAAEAEAEEAAAEPSMSMEEPVEAVPEPVEASGPEKDAETKPPVDAEEASPEEEPGAPVEEAETVSMEVAETTIAETADGGWTRTEETWAVSYGAGSGQVAEVPVGPDEDDALPAGQTEPDPVVTETMGDIFAAQGHHEQALEVYRQLLDRSPDDDRLKRKVERVEADLARAPESEARAPADRTPRPTFAAAETGGTSIRQFFSVLLAKAPGEEAVAGPAPTAPAGSSAPEAPIMDEAFGEEAEVTREGEPTRPASGPLSLSAIFGEDSSPVPPAMSSESADDERAERRSGGLSFGEFFGDKPSGKERRPRTTRLSQAEQDDLDQFHQWLKGLKN